MKKLILSVVLATFAVAVQAGEDKACADKQASGCCAKAKAAQQAKAECPVAAKQAKAATCPATAKDKNTASKEASNKPLKSPKAVASAAK
ncbi:MAG TPA: hypothetical protein VEC99_08480 [Clostridia bacterium]|nr:hypothetical protein [Clostridia bacterium]